MRMKCSERLFRLARVSALALLATGAYGQATRTWVSGVGDDANPCSRTAPCKTFAGAISKTAAGGEIDALDPGGFGAVTITKSITIDGSPYTAGVLVTGGVSGIVINAGASDVVTLRGISFDGVGGQGLKGISVLQAGRVVVDHCQIFGFSPRAISVEPNANPVEVFISDTLVKGSASNGIVVAPASAAISARVTLNRVNVAGSLNFGLSVTGGGIVAARDSTFSENGLTTSLANIRVDGSAGSATVDLDNVLVDGSTTGIIALNSAIVRVNNSSIVNNTGAAISASAASVLSFGNNRVVGNNVNGTFTGSATLQ